MVEDSGSAHGERSSALWGTGSRGGEHRSSTLWGTGSRGGEHRSRGRVVAILTLLSFALALPAAAAEKSEKPEKPSLGSWVVAGSGSLGVQERRVEREPTHVAADLFRKAKDRPGERVRVIIQSKEGPAGAERVFRGLGHGNKALRRLDLVSGIVVEIPAALVERLARIPGLIVTPDAPVKSSGLPWNRQLWPHESGNSLLWFGDSWKYGSSTPAIAIVDSGIESGRSDFGGRVLADVKINQSDTGDSRGHGTVVAGIAAGSAAGQAGAAPVAPLVSVDVMDHQGMAYVSDVIAAAEWILANKGRYNIRVANFSLHTALAGSIRWDPLARAVEQLWFSGVVVVAAAGNYGRPDGPSGVVSAPGNNPFVITVGAIDIGRTASTRDDSVAPWSAYGYTLDGFAKPELGAAGRYMIGPVPEGSTLAAERADKLVGPGYIELSGTSLAAPVVAGAAAQLLARHPEWTPGQVKGALMLTARPVPGSPFGAAGVGQITVTKAALLNDPPDANAALAPFVVADPVTGDLVFDTAAWASAAWASAAWSSAAWASAAWSSAAWASAAWASAAWASAAWASAAWADAAWASAAWADAAWADNAAGDPAVGGYDTSETNVAEILADPDLLHPEADGTVPVSDPTLVQEGTADAAETTTTDAVAETTSETTGAGAGTTIP